MTALTRAIGLLIVMAASVAAQQTSRDGASAPVTATASIAGTVLTDETAPRPLRRVIVSLTAIDLPFGHTTITDDLGRFTFSELPAGRFTLVATKPAYLTTYYRNLRPGRPPAVPIPLTAGQQLAGITLKMLRGAVVAGTLRDQNGRPAPLSTVQVMLVQTINGERTVNRALSGGYATTDERGTYRMFGLVPGDYVVSAAVPQFGGAGFGDARVTTPDDITRARIAIREASALTAPQAPAAPLPPSATDDEPKLGYATVYFPGTTDFSAAQLVTIGPAEERGSVDFTLQMVRMAKIAGTVVGPNGPLGTTIVNLVSQGPTGASSSGRPTDNSGGFTFTNIAPGTYNLLARAMGPRDAANGVSNPQPLSANLDLTIDGHNVNGLTLTLQPGVNVSGRVVIDPAASGTLDLTTTRIGLESMFAGGGATFSVTPTQPDATGAFTLSGVSPGKYRMTATIQGAPAGAKWTVKSAIVAGHDMSELGNDIHGGESITNALVTLTDRTSEVSGMVQNASGAPASEYSIVVFSADRQYWTKNSKRVKGPVRPGVDGHYLVSELPPGDYFLAAATGVDASELADASLLDQLAAAAIRVAIGEGEKKVQDIRIGGLSLPSGPSVRARR